MCVCVEKKLKFAVKFCIIWCKIYFYVAHHDYENAVLFRNPLIFIAEP